MLHALAEGSLKTPQNSAAYSHEPAMSAVGERQPPEGFDGAGLGDLRDPRVPAVVGHENDAAAFCGLADGPTAADVGKGDSEEACVGARRLGGPGTATVGRGQNGAVVADGQTVVDVGECGTPEQVGDTHIVIGDGDRLTLPGLSAVGGCDDEATPLRRGAA